LSSVNPLRWHDLPLAYRLAGQGCGFDSRLKITVGDDTVRQALLTGIGRTHIYTLRRPEGSGLGQLHYPDGIQTAWMAYLSPALDETEETIWLTLIDGLVAAAGEKGTINLVAEVDDDNSAMQILKRCNFAVYAHQDIWYREPVPVEGDFISSREANKTDHVSIQMLHHAVTPSLLRQVIPSPLSADACIVAEADQGLLGLAAIYTGGNTLIDVYMSRNTDPNIASKVVRGVLHTLNAESNTVYCRLRGQMTWLGEILRDDLNFEFVTSQAVMVRHTAHHIKHHAFEKLPAAIDGITSVS